MRPMYNQNQSHQHQSNRGYQQGGQQNLRRSRGQSNPNKYSQNFGGYNQIRNDQAYSDYYGAYGEQGFGTVGRRREETYPDYDDNYSSQSHQNNQNYPSQNYGGQTERGWENQGVYGSYGSQNYGPASYESQRLGSERWASPSYGPSPSQYGPSQGQSQQKQQGKFSGIGPKGYKRSDERIREEVCDALAQDPNIDASEIDVEVGDGTVTLSGTVESRSAKRQVEDCIQDVTGVQDITNNIRVASSTNSSRSSSKSDKMNGSSSQSQGQIGSSSSKK